MIVIRAQGGRSGSQFLRYLNVVAWGRSAPPVEPRYENTQQGSGLNPRRGVPTAFQVRRRGGRRELDSLSASSGRGFDAIPPLPHTSRAPVSKGGPLLQTHKRPTTMSVDLY